MDGMPGIDDPDRVGRPAHAAMRTMLGPAGSTLFDLRFHRTAWVRTTLGRCA